MIYTIKFFIACILAIVFGMFGYRKGLEKLKRWIE